jgi:hypothetical protein
MEDVIEKVEEVVVEPTPEPTKDEIALDEVKKAKAEAQEAKKLADDLKALLEAKEKNEKSVQELLAEEKAKNESLIKLSEENAEWAKKVKETNDLMAQKKIEEEKAKILEQLKETNKKLAEKDKEIETVKKAVEFKDYKEKLAKEKSGNPLLYKAILEAESQSIIDFALKMWDNQETLDIAKMTSAIGKNAFEDTIVVKGDTTNDLDSALDDIISKKYGKK